MPRVLDREQAFFPGKIRVQCVKHKVNGEAYRDQ